MYAKSERGKDRGYPVRHYLLGKNTGLVKIGNMRWSRKRMANAQGKYPTEIQVNQSDSFCSDHRAHRISRCESRHCFPT